MSQKKVDEYKQQKANYQKNKKKQKLVDIFQDVVIILVFALVIGWIGYSVYGKLNEDKRAQENAPKSTVVNFDSVNKYLAEINDQGNKK